MENVLNEYESKDLIYRTLFSKLTFLFSIWNCVLFSYAIFSVPTSINTRNGAPAVSKLLICVYFSVKLTPFIRCKLTPCFDVG